jgi:hypothetical protein
MRKFALIAALLLVAVTSVMGLISLPGEFRQLGGTLMQRSVAFGAAVHSVLGMLVVLGALRRRRWAVNAAGAWTIAVVYTASVASVAWESPRDAGVLLGGVAAGISCALMGWWVVWAARASVRPHISASTDSPSSLR